MAHAPWPTMLVLALSPIAFCLAPAIHGDDRPFLSRVDGKVPTPEETVRIAYARLAALQRAGVGARLDIGSPSPKPDELLTFTIDDVSTGSVTKLLEQKYGDYVTKPTGEIINIVVARETTPDGGHTARYYASWAKGQTFDENWDVPFRVAMAPYPQRFHAVASYVAYRVTVRLDGKARTYRAIAFFGAPDKAGYAKPDFQDLIVGLGGQVGMAYEEDASTGPFFEAMRQVGVSPDPLLLPRRARNPIALPSTCRDGECCDDSGDCCREDDGCSWDSCHPEDCPPPPRECGFRIDFGGEWDQRRDTTGHSSGYHEFGSTLGAVCREDLQCRQHCNVPPGPTMVAEVPDSLVPFGCHRFSASTFASESGVGSCWGAFGAAVAECFLCTCSPPWVQVSRWGTSSPGSLWTYHHGRAHECNW